MIEAAQALVIVVATMVVTFPLLLTVEWVREHRRREYDMYTRPFRWRRAMSPTSVIGFLLGYGECPCGTNWWRDKGACVEDTRGGGSTVCTGCYNAFKEQIDHHNELMWERQQVFYTGPKITPEARSPRCRYF